MVVAVSCVLIRKVHLNVDVEQDSNFKQMEEHVQVSTFLILGVISIRSF